ncbi:M14 family metallopeptidase [Croceitalea rosinachiae]|uniref:M14 family metallopeptidase n=1 Tax=Croceitalea rosinachiae TaxID=3075596 RepID=A0ABU3ADY8_9FLAO|nr:M14 family metallopeptidase [Croceitalea sp. F388]MDT0608395.1 M14 family metallopeptidase [Croceitalea sp. F388]
MRTFLTLFTLLFLISCETTTNEETTSFKTVFETSDGLETATYDEVIQFYLQLAKNYPEINVQTIGSTDSGYPLHLVTFNSEGDFNYQKLANDKTIVLVNNGIHPGESDGIDATMMLYRDLVERKIKHPNNVVLVTIPVYNVGGMLNRNSTTRANQNGPKSYGFRGNAQNYDLNRDFIKADTKNAQSFIEIFHLTKPDIFIDNHVSNGADYQYTLTHLFTQHNKLGGDLGQYLHTEFMPKLEQKLQESNWDITPYVNVFNRPPETGFTQFMDSPRYSTGYAALWNTLGMMVETHMLKPYKPRVEGAYELMKQMISIAENNHEKIKELRNKSIENYSTASTYHLNWEVDTTQTTTLQFKGFEVDTLISEITNLPRLKYDKNRPFIKKVKYSNYYVPKDTIEVPAAYIIKKGWQKVIDRLDFNHIDYFELDKDTTLYLESYKIKDYKTRNSAYEGHYLHYNTQIGTSVQKIQLQKGDYVVPANQEGLRYLLETLEPQAPDSFFNWNFFDTVLQQKEGFSPYVFEDIALEILKQNQSLRDSFLAKKQSDQQFSENWYAQLDWIYKHSPYYESAHLQYPVYRIKKRSSAESILKN